MKKITLLITILLGQSLFSAAAQDDETDCLFCSRTCVFDITAPDGKLFKTMVLSFNFFGYLKQLDNIHACIIEQPLDTKQVCIKFSEEPELILTLKKEFYRTSNPSNNQLWEFLNRINLIKILESRAEVKPIALSAKVVDAGNKYNVLSIKSKD